MQFDINGKWVIIKDSYRDYEISIATNTHGRNADIMVFDTRKKDDQNVTKEFQCFQGGEIDGTIENLRTVMNEIDERYRREMGIPYYSCEADFDLGLPLSSHPRSSQNVWICEKCTPITKNSIVLSWHATNTNGVKCLYKLKNTRPDAYGKDSCDICGQ